jgi:hypothetical protein
MRLSSLCLSELLEEFLLFSKLGSLACESSFCCACHGSLLSPALGGNPNNAVSLEALEVAPMKAAGGWATKREAKAQW